MHLGLFAGFLLCFIGVCTYVPFLFFIKISQYILMSSGASSLIFFFFSRVFQAILHVYFFIQSSRTMYIDPGKTFCIEITLSLYIKLKKVDLYDVDSSQPRTSVCYMPLCHLQLTPGDVHSVPSSTPLITSCRLIPMAPFKESIQVIFSHLTFSQEQVCPPLVYVSVFISSIFSVYALPISC